MEEKKKIGHNFKFSKSEEQEVINFMSKQSNLTDVLRYLIQVEIAKNGIRDLSLHIPSVRTINSLREQLNIQQSQTCVSSTKLEATNAREIIKEEPQVEDVKEVEIDDCYQ